VRAVAEFGLSTAVGPLRLSTLNAWGEEGGLLGNAGGGQGATQGAAEQEVSLLLKRAMTAAKKVLAANEALLERIGATLEVEEKLSGEPLAALLRDVKGAPELRDFVNGR